jgi:hypothetical protein
VRTTAIIAVTLLLAGAVPAATAAEPSTTATGPSSTTKTSPFGVNEARGGRGFGGRTSFGRRSRPGFGTRRPAARPPVRRRPLFRHGFFNSVLRALGIAYLVHLLFGWGAGGGSPFGLLLVLGVVLLWLSARRRRRRAAPYW